MDIIDKLASLGVVLPTAGLPVDYSLYERGKVQPFHMRRRLMALGKVQPLVSCLMVTRGDRPTIRCAIESYRRQTYADRELVIVVDRPNYEAVAALVGDGDIGRVSLFGVDVDLTLGDCRNISVARAQGEVLMQWDDDDLSDPSRVAASVSALTQSSAAAALLSRWLIWWPGRELAAISGRRIWEGSIAVWREHAPIYPGIARGEDTFITECLANSRSLALIDQPLLYVYVVTGDNTFDAQHHDDLIAQADWVARGDAYHDLLEILSARMPILDYRAAVVGRRG